MTKQHLKEFKDHRISWKWYRNHIEKNFDIQIRMKKPEITSMLIQLEILKELQYANDKH